MTRQSRKQTEERRIFLKKLAAVAMSNQAVAAPDQDLASAETEERGYHETPHIRSYYRTARL